MSRSNLFIFPSPHVRARVEHTAFELLHGGGDAPACLADGCARHLRDAAARGIAPEDMQSIEEVFRLEVRNTVNRLLYQSPRHLGGDAA